MGRNAMATLLHPFEAGLVESPGSLARLLFLGAEPGLRLPDGFGGDLKLVQGFRPTYRALETAGYEVSPVLPNGHFDAALVVCGRHRGQNELRIADALERLVPGGLLLVAGAKEDGIQSLRKRVARLVKLDGHAPKYHGEAFWLRRNEDASAAIGVLRSANRPVLLDSRFRTSPGMFSSDAVDVGSALLARSLPGGISGDVADFCAGWGYLAAEALKRNAGIASLDLFEADFDSLEAARLNVDGGAVPVGFFWQDLLAEPVSRRYDIILMNPPFHTDRAADPGIGQGMILAAAAALKARGRMYLVANRQLPYERVLAQSFPVVRVLASDKTFKAIEARG